MPFELSTNKHEKISKAIDLLSIEIDGLLQETDRLFQELQITPEQLNSFMEKKKDNISDHDWQRLIKEKEALDIKLERTLANIQNPNTTKQKLSDLHKMRHCLFVR